MHVSSVSEQILSSCRLARAKLCGQQQLRRWRAQLTQAFGQQIANKFVVVSHVEDAVDTGGHQLLLGVSKVAHHVLGNKHDAALAVDHEEETVEGLKSGRECV